ncbi:MAG: magnesium-translocating P-type ATPase [Pirellulaceae bacterium]
MENATGNQAFWSIETDQLLEQVGTSVQGLTLPEAKQRLARASRLKPHRTSAWSLLWDQFKSPIILLLFCSAVLSLTLLDDATNGLIIVFILVASGLLSFWQELSAADAVAKLMGMIETKATVIREGLDYEVPLDAIVSGDVVRLRAGDLIPGDCRLLTARDLFVNEAVLTGESFPAEKSCSVLPEPTPLGQRVNSVFLGTNVISGFATAVVVGTGPETEFGKISERLEHKQPETGFERGLRHFGQLLVKVVLTITVVVFAVKVGWQGKEVVDSLIVGLALAVGMTPQLLPAITSVVLASGAKAMAKHQVIVKQLLSIENLGSMTVLCSDKTGTLTDGVVQLQDTLDLAGRSSERVARYAYLNAYLQTGFANPIDRAIGDRQKFDTSGVEKLDEIPYDFIRKRLSVRVADNGQKLLITKGALAQVLECCSQAAMSGGELVDLAEQRAAIDRQFSEMSNKGLRVLGLAIRAVNAPHVSKADEQDMTFLGFLVFADPPKADAAQTIAELRDLGVALKIITGDNHAVAATISRRVGITSPVIVTGSDLRSLSTEAFVQRARQADVFVEVEPNQKEQIILALKQSGEVVGYLGDGINDASAIHAADVGISVASAVDVAREAAQIVLLQQDLGVLVRGVREGRRTFSNTLKYVFYVIAANFGYMFSLAVASLFMPFEPLLASQILLVNLLADFPAMALATDSVDPEQIQRPRRWDVRFIVRFMMSFGFASSMFDFMTFGAMFYIFREMRTAGSAETFEQLFHTGWFVESTLTGLMILAVVRTRRPFFLSRPGRLFLLAEISMALVAVLLPYSPFAASLGFVKPPAILLAITLVITLLYGVGMEVVKRVFYRYAAT